MESQSSNSRTVTIAIVSAIVALLLGLCGGAAIGGVAGYAFGRSAETRASRSSGGLTLPQPFRTTPEVPGSGQSQQDNTVSGVLVQDVVANSPADQAGIQPGDVVTQVNDIQISDNKPLINILSQFKPGDRVRLTISRGGSTRTLNVTLGSAPSNSQQAYLGIRYSTTSVSPQSTPQP